MVDNVAITAGSGTSIATDEVSGDHYQKIKLAVGAADTATLAVMTEASSSFDRPADTAAYGVGDAIADNTTAGSVTPLSYTIAAGAGTIRRVRVLKDTPATIVVGIRVWFFDTSVTVGAGDNAAFVSNTPLTSCIGFVDVPITAQGSDFAAGWASCDIPFVAGTLKALIETEDAFTPASADTWQCDIWYIPG